MATTDVVGSMEELTPAFSTDLVDLKAGGEAGLTERGIQAGVVGDDDEGRIEGSSDLGRSSPDLSDGGRARETE